MDWKIGYSEWGGLIKDVTDASDWSKRFNFYISGLLPIFSEFSRFSRFSELKKAPSAEDLWLGDFLQAPAISIKIRLNYCQLIKKRDLSSNSWYFFILYYRFYDRKSSKSSKTLAFCWNRSFFSQKYPNFFKFIFKLTSKWLWNDLGMSPKLGLLMTLKTTWSRKVFFLDHSQ